MSESKRALLLDILDVLENREASLLAWGLVDGGFSRDVLLDEIDEILDARRKPERAEDVLTELVDRGLVVELHYPTAPLFRSRMAETVRLLARSRQLFERDLRGEGWRTAPALVADYRIQIRPRRFPVRDVRPKELDRLLKENGATPHQRTAARQVLGSDEIRLSGFQVRSSVEILAGLQEGAPKSVIITAGTGSGKTLAFYLPALAEISSILDSQRWVKAMAVYPRNELLKDQFSEAYRSARRLDHLMKQAGKRPLSIGAFFGLSPYSAKSVAEDGDWGKKYGEGWICPYIRCPDCGGDVIWRDSDAHQSLERLVCALKDCDGRIEASEIVLTRQRLMREPPDILFTTTEMLNQRITDNRYRHLFGLGPHAKQKPRLVLLDEVHTYMGTHGAHVALLLRRWAHALSGSVVFVGLSATLKDAERFMADLSGVPPTDVVAIQAHEHEMVSEGMEYLVALRGDPSSGVSLLSTTIQASMLLGRALDPRQGVSSDTYGKRVFIFTDDLDITNRLYYDLLDAEGYDAFGNPRTSSDRPNGALANLRSSIHPDRERRLIAGQSWDMVEALGRSLDPTSRLQVGRTSSQDVGVDTSSDLIVSTAALEVGYNDPAVGGVLQHKSPKSASQFLQRRGRAGRLRHMRPWTVVVLSDYGRDRITYQSYEELFDPNLEPRRLPVRNRYVIRMQAVYALMDWLAEQVTEPVGSIWQDLAGPYRRDSKDQRTARGSRRNQILRILNSVLKESNTTEQLSDYLKAALGIDDQEVQAVLWEPPRSLLLEVIPTIRRRLITNWRNRFPLPEGSDEYQVRNSPLPEFIPRALFADLALPEVTVALPAQTQNSAAEHQNLPIAQAIREFAPGRVTRRYATRHGHVRHWVDPSEPTVEHEGYVAIGDICDLSVHLETTDIDGKPTGVFRPWSLRASKPPRDVADSSNAFPIWKSRIKPTASVTSLEPPRPSAWADLIQNLEFHTHNRNSPVEVLRVSVGAQAVVNRKDGSSSEFRVKFQEDSQPAGLGFNLAVDGIRVRYKTPILHNLDFRPQELRSLRSARFHRLVTSDETLAEKGGSFKPAWLARLYEACLVQQAMQMGTTLLAARESIGADLGDQLEATLEDVFGSLSLDEWDQGPQERPSRLRSGVIELIGDREVLKLLDAHASSLWDEPNQEWEPWLAERFRSTLGTALIEACERMVPETSSSDLILDIDLINASSDDVDEIWITETTVGGAGVVEQIALKYAENPRRFFRLVSAALESSDFELVDSELQRTLTLLDESDALTERANQLRSITNPSAGHQALQQFLRELADENVFVAHPVVAAISARILRPGSSAQSDSLLRRVINDWQRAEEQLGVEIDARAIAHAMAEREDIDSAFRDTTLPPEPERRRWRSQTLMSMLWPRGWEVRSTALATYNPFSNLPPTDRWLMNRALQVTEDEVDVDRSDWPEVAELSLGRTGAITVVSTSGNLKRMRRALLQLLAEPVEIGYLLLFPRLVGVRRKPRLAMRLSLEEAPQ